MPKKILIAPLDWGLGHATRCIPIIHQLLNEGHEVLIAADGNIKQLLKEEFPQQTFIHLKGYHVSYSSKLPAWLKILLQLPKIFFRIIAEHQQLKKIIHEYNIDIVISDNRFGLWNKKVKSIYITHQLMIKCPKWLKAFESLLCSLHFIFIKRYDTCWIPDFEGENNLSGELSHKYIRPGNARFIGILSRFENTNQNTLSNNELCIIISGPEPSRSEFETLIFNQLKYFKGNVIVVLGKPENSGFLFPVSNFQYQVFSHLDALKLQEIISRSQLIVCRSGYSGIMDLIRLKKEAVLVPTPGQTEQEYLADYFHQKKIFRSVSQKNLDLVELQKDSMFSVKNFKAEETNLLQQEIKRIMESE